MLITDFFFLANSEGSLKKKKWWYKSISDVEKTISSEYDPRVDCLWLHGHKTKEKYLHSIP